MTMIPKPPQPTCIHCAGRRFISLTFPDIAHVEGSDRPAGRTTARRTTCGLRYVGTKPLSDAEPD